MKQKEWEEMLPEQRRRVIKAYRILWHRLGDRMPDDRLYHFWMAVVRMMVMCRSDLLINLGKRMVA